MGNWRRFWIWALATFGLDQVTKIAIVHMFGLKSLIYVEVWYPYLVLRMGWNTGINFGFLPGGGAASQVILILAAFVICGLGMWWVRPEKNPWAWASLGLLVGGAMGNVVDRILFGAVADFLNMSCCGLNNEFIFNVADIAIFAGAFGLILFTRSKNEA